MPYLKLFLKQKFPLIYRLVRKWSFSLYLKKRAGKISSMDEVTKGNFTYQDVSFPIILKKENGFVDQEIFWKGCYEEEVLLAIEKNLPSGGTYVDIGSNIGQHAFFAAKINGGGKVIAFEPIEKLYRQILNSIELNSFKNIEVHKFACGEKKEEKEIFFSKENMGGSSLVDRTARSNKESIKIVQGDTILLSEDRIDLIKIDTEGFEYEVLLGIKQVLKKYHPMLIIEYSPVFYRKSKKEHGVLLLNLLEEHGYSVTTIDDGGKVTLEKNLAHLDSLYPDQVNILCKPALLK